VSEKKQVRSGGSASAERTYLLPELFRRLSIARRPPQFGRFRIGENEECERRLSDRTQRSGHDSVAAPTPHVLTSRTLTNSTVHVHDPVGPFERASSG